jgi:hypothetical protein
VKIQRAILSIAAAVILAVTMGADAAGAEESQCGLDAIDLSRTSTRCSSSLSIETPGG